MSTGHGKFGGHLAKIDYDFNMSVSLNPAD